MASIALQSAASGLNALSTKLDVVANNLANVNTTGFKSSRANFQDLLYVERQQPGVENANGDQRPIGLHVGLGVQVAGTQLNFEQGSPIATGRPLDIMIDGLGFLQVGIEEGQTAYTRAGNLTMNSDGELVLASDVGSNHASTSPPMHARSRSAPTAASSSPSPASPNPRKSGSSNWQASSTRPASRRSARTSTPRPPPAAHPSWATPQKGITAASCRASSNPATSTRRSNSSN